MRMGNPQKKSTNISLPADVVAEAKALGVNISKAAEKGVVAELTARRREKWLEENRAAIESNNEWVERNGLPLARYRMF
ncbi:MAG: type II toxin-antitoxin system CcdA family antitoxin [Sphingomonadales bacterium]|nr:type II toxin-antitoxin system CcdA family antitoxin [Sphingomonadales bacterium]